MGCHLYLITFLLLYFSGAWWSVAVAQSSFEMIRRDRNLSASNYCIYPDSALAPLTPAPAGKHPFYISHYGRHGSRYLNNRKAYDIPYNYLMSADSLGLLTAKGQEVLSEMRYIIDDSEGRWGELSDLGRLQHRQIATRMVERFPEVFEGNAFIDAKSTVVNRCVLSMGSAVQQLMALNPDLEVTMEASRRNMWYMNHQDTLLRNRMSTPKTQKAFDDYCEPLVHNHRLMEMLFVNPDSARKVVSEKWLNYYLIKTGFIQQNTNMSKHSKLIDLFSYEDLHCHWLCENAWWYFSYGPSLLNGAEEPYTQRYLLRKIINEADSCMRKDCHGASLRFGHETIVLPLACLLGINGFDFETENLADLEAHGWWACLVFPMASNIQLVFYRESIDDKDVVFKVLLNEQEATLPIPTDIAPYYHWRDFREHYLKKIDDYEAK